MPQTTAAELRPPARLDRPVRAERRTAGSADRFRARLDDAREAERNAPREAARHRAEEPPGQTPLETPSTPRRRRTETDDRAPPTTPTEESANVNKNGPDPAFAATPAPDAGAASASAGLPAGALPAAVTAPETFGPTLFESPNAASSVLDPATAASSARTNSETVAAVSGSLAAASGGGVQKPVAGTAIAARPEPLAGASQGSGSARPASSEQAGEVATNRAEPLSRNPTTASPSTEPRVPIDQAALGAAGGPKGQDKARSGTDHHGDTLGRSRTTGDSANDERVRPRLGAETRDLGFKSPIARKTPGDAPNGVRGGVGDGATAALGRFLVTAATGASGNATPAAHSIVGEVASAAPQGRANGVAARAEGSTTSALAMGVEGRAELDAPARIFAARADSGRYEATLHLEPPELGSVRVQVRLHDQALMMRISADNAEVGRLIESRMADLRDALASHGIRVNRAEVSVRAESPAETTHGPANQNEAPSSARDPRSGHGFGGTADSNAHGRESSDSSAGGRSNGRQGADREDRAPDARGPAWSGGLGMDASRTAEPSVDLLV